MEIVTFTIGKNGDWGQFYRCLLRHLQHMEHHFRYEFQIVSHHQVRLVCADSPAEIVDEHVHDLFRGCISRALSEYVIAHLETDMMQNVIEQQYRESLGTDIPAVLRYCQQLLCLKDDEDTVDEQKLLRRQGIVYKQVDHYLQTSTHFDLDGFIHFRLKPYRQELEDIITYAVDEFKLEKEYQEFIRLLQYMLSIQRPKRQLLHVFHVRERQFELYDEHYQRISNDEIQRYLHEWATRPIVEEDLIVSTLIACAPQHVVLHTVQPAHTIVQTIQAIFEQRIRVCTNCTDCLNWRENRDGLNKDSAVKKELQAVPNESKLEHQLEK